MAESCHSGSRRSAATRYRTYWSKFSNPGAVDAGEAGATHHGHGNRKFLLQNSNDARDTRLSSHCEAVQIGTTDKDRVRAIGKRFKHICATSDATIHQDRYAAGDPVDHLWKRINGGGHRIQVTTTMVGHDDARSSRLDGLIGIVRIQYSPSAARVRERVRTTI